jgi:hypothetical protein
MTEATTESEDSLRLSNTSNSDLACDSPIMRVLMHVHESVWPFDAHLVERAKHSEIGRRMLANALMPVAPHLFGLPMPVASKSRRAGDAANIAELNPWICLSQEQLDAHVLDFGALLFAGAIRSTIIRKPLQILRQALGEDRYAMILRADLSGVDQAWQERAKRLFNASILLPETLLPLLRHEGSQELLNLYGARDHYFLERLKLAYPWVQAGDSVRLSQNLLDDYLLKSSLLPS